MKPELIISIIAMSFTSITFILIYRRDSRRNFTYRLFEEKLEIYNKVILELSKVFSVISSLSMELQEFDGSNEDWVEYIQKASPKCYQMITTIRNLTLSYQHLLPEIILSNTIELTNNLEGHITNHYHYDTILIEDSFQNIYTKYSKLIRLVQKDLNIKAIEKELSLRLLRSYYPIGLNSAN